MDTVERIAAAVLYEGYLLWPYRRSAQKNQKRWTFGGVYPRAYSEAGASDDAWLMQTQCLIAGERPSVSVRVRFLQVVERCVARRLADGSLEAVDALQVGSERYLAWDEAVEREIVIPDLQLAEMAARDQPRQAAITIAAGEAEEPLHDQNGVALGALLRRWRAIEGSVSASVEPLAFGLRRLTLTITNTTPWNGDRIGGTRDDALRQSLIATHTILHVEGGEFISLTDPPAEFASEAAACQNIKTWPVLVGAAGERQTMLSAPIILPDYPQIAPESPGDHFDGTEIDELLVLNILSLSDAEKEEMRASDPRSRQILERTEALTSEDFMRLHGAIREFRMLSEEETDAFVTGLERPAPESVLVNGVVLRRGSRVRLRPRAGGDILDLALAGKAAVVVGIEQDYEERIQLAVTVEDDPGRDLGAAQQIGHRFFFAPEEVTPLGEGNGV